jgi:hypothetical protein
MHRIERAVSDWHRVYNELCAAQDCLRRGEGAPPGETVAGADLVAQVDRLQNEEEQALHAIDDALCAAKTRAAENGSRKAGDGPA